MHSKKPFVGTAGTKLNQALEKAGIERSDIYITNSVLCYTANNSKPPIESINACKYYLKAQLEILEPSIVIVMGASASRSFNFDGEFSVKLCEEQKIYNTDMHSKVMFTVHPMFTIYAGDRGMNILVKSFEIAKSNLD